MHTVRPAQRMPHPHIMTRLLCALALIVIVFTARIMHAGRPTTGNDGLTDRERAKLATEYENTGGRKPSLEARHRMAHTMPATIDGHLRSRYFNGGTR